MIVFYNSRYIPLEDVAISPFDRGFLFADGVYESIRTYSGKLFKFEEHLQRLKRSSNEIQVRYSKPEKLEETIYELIKKNNIEKEALIYLQITRGLSFPRTHSFPAQDVEPTIFISASPFKSNNLEQKEGIKAILFKDIRWMRCDIKSVSLLPNVLANQKAKEAGAGEAILVKEGLITEGTHTNFFAVKDNVLYTAPVSNNILAGITRRVVIELASELNIDVKEEFIKENEFKTYSEFFITSTKKEITPVVGIDNWIVGIGKPDKITVQLQEAFKSLTNDY